MARTFENVSPFGDLILNGRTVDFGATVDVDDATAKAMDSTNWREVVPAKPKK